MELNATTFLLEIANFLILVWILKRFLYRPVKDVLEQRRRRVEETTARAERLHAEAQAMRAQYETRLGDWEAERQRAREKLQEEFREERARQMASLQSELEREREKSRILEQRRCEEAARKMEQRAMDLGSRFAGTLLGQAATPELEARLLELLLEQLPRMPEDRREQLDAVFAEENVPVHVFSAFPLSAEQRRVLQEALSTVVDQPVQCSYEEQPALLAGLRITLGPLVLRANLADELQLFRDAAHESA